MSPETKIFVKTTGIFMEELLHNETLEYSYIILDEVHERDLYIDLVLALLKNYFKYFQKSNIKLILMSATITEKDFSKYLKDINGKDIEIPIIRVEEKWKEVKVFNIDEIISILLNSKKISKELKRLIEVEKSNCLSLKFDLPTFLDSLFPVVAGIIETTSYKANSGILIFIPDLREIEDVYDYLTNYFKDKNFAFTSK